MPTQGPLDQCSHLEPGFAYIRKQRPLDQCSALQKVLNQLFIGLASRILGIQHGFATLTQRFKPDETGKEFGQVLSSSGRQDALIAPMAYLVRRLAFRHPCSPQWYGLVSVAGRGGGGQGSQTRPGSYASPTQAINRIT